LSTIKATTLSNLAGSKTVPTDTVVDGSAKAWVNFNGTGTVAIRRAFNVSSITDNGTGDYTVNFTNAMVDANYGVVTTTEGDSVPDRRYIAPLKFNGRSVSSVGLWVSASATNSALDSACVSVAIFS